MKDSVREFDNLQADDPLAKDNDAGIKKLDQARQTFVAKSESTDLYTSARHGVLPPGVSTRTWFDADHAWAYGMAVYVPSMTKAAADAKAQMDASDPLHASRDSGSGNTQSQGNGFTDEKNPTIARPAPTTQPGPSGTVSPNGGL